MYPSSALLKADFAVLQSFDSALSEKPIFPLKIANVLTDYLPSATPGSALATMTLVRPESSVAVARINAIYAAAHEALHAELRVTKKAAKKLQKLVSSFDVAARPPAPPPVRSSYDGTVAIIHPPSSSNFGGHCDLPLYPTLGRATLATPSASPVARRSADQPDVGTVPQGAGHRTGMSSKDTPDASSNPPSTRARTLQSAGSPVHPSRRPRRRRSVVLSSSSSSDVGAASPDVLPISTLLATTLACSDAESDRVSKPPPPEEDCSTRRTRRASRSVSFDEPPLTALELEGVSDLL